MSQLDSETKEIGGHKFEVFKLSPFDAQDVLIDIGQVFAPALGKATAALGGSSKGKNALDMDVDDPAVSTAIAMIAKNLTKERMRALIRTMASVSHCDGTPLPKTMEIVFRGDLPLMYQWLWFALQVNFGNFTGWLGNAISDVKGKRPAAPSQTT